MGKKYFKRELCFETPEEKEKFDNIILNLKNKTGIERADIIVMKALEIYKKGVIK